MSETELQLPSKDDGQNVENDVVDDHDDRVGIKECFDVDASSRSILVPEMCDRYTLEDDDENAADTKAECNKLHEPDDPVVPTLVRCVTVEEEERKLDEHVAGEVEAEDGDVQLMTPNQSHSHQGRKGQLKTHTHLVKLDLICRTCFPVMAAKAILRRDTL